MIGNDKEFIFKKFKVKHGKNSLPITTEVLIFGGILANNISNERIVLDIGTGCGILPLMIAQKNNVAIHSVEIDKNAFELANENIQNSNFSNQIKVFHADIKAFKSPIGENEIDKYELIFSNPPFFQNHFKGKNAQQNIAKHNDELPFDKLAEQIERLLSKNGQFMVLLPEYELSILTHELAKFKILKNAEFYIYHRQNSKVLRIIATFGYKLTDFQPTNFYIKDETENYTQQFIELLKDYYLIF